MVVIGYAMNITIAIVKESTIAFIPAIKGIPHPPNSRFKSVYFSVVNLKHKYNPPN
jgi:hypothetical protein